MSILRQLPVLVSINARSDVPRSVCPTPSAYYGLAKPPIDTPKSLKDYTSWHRSARDCLISDRCTVKPKTIVFTCRDGCSGGLGDRFRGMELVFLLALFSKRLFLIDWPAGPNNVAPLETAFQPVSIDWRIPDGLNANLSSFEHLNWSFKKDTHLPLPSKNGNNFFLNIRTQNFTASIADFDNIAISSNAPHSLHFDLLRNKQKMENFKDLHSNNVRPGVVIQMIVHILFRPTDVVLKYSMNASFESDSEYIAVHARIGDDTGESDRTRFTELSPNIETVSLNLLSCAQKVAREQSKAKKKPTHLLSKQIFLASDSERLKEVFMYHAGRRNISVKTTSGKALHLGKNHEEVILQSYQDQCKAFLNVFVDLWLLSKANYIITTGSGFSKAAFHLGDTENVLIGHSSRHGSMCRSERLGLAL